MEHALSKEELLLEIKEGVKEAIVDLFLFEPEAIQKILGEKL